MDSIQLSLEEEIALEGLDGITLDSLWFRLSERLKLPLPFCESFKEKLFKIVVKRPCYEFFAIAQPRKTVGRLDRTSLISGDEEALQQVKEFYNIYSWAPVDDPEIRGSCEEFKTREQIDRESLKDKNTADLDKIYGQRLVVVASQKLRSSALIPSNVGRDVDINNHVYCMLEKIGRARHFGETTSGPYSINDHLKDAKLIHYFRLCLLKNNLVIRQVISLKAVKKAFATCQLFHLPKFFFTVQSTQLRHIEALFTHLVTKESNAATLDEVRNLLKLGSKTTISSIRTRPDIFEYRQFSYSEIFPNASREECTLKKGKERKVTAVKLVDPNFDIFDLFKDESEHKDPEEDGSGFLNLSTQHIKRPLLPQVIAKIKESKSEGISQTDIANHFGLSRLNARSVIRKALRTSKDITSYLKDEGRQRVSKFICKEFLSDKNKEFVDQVAKILKTTDERTAQLSKLTVSTAETRKSTRSSVSPIEPLDITSFSLKSEEPTQSVINFVQHLPNESFEEAVSDFSVTQVFNDETVMVVPHDECSFVNNIENVKVTLRYLSNIPGVQKQFMGLQAAIAENKVSQKVLSRMNIILDVIREKTVIDVVNLLQTLRQREANYSELCCRKSMLTLCGRLAADHLIKVIQMELISATNVVKLIFFGVPNATFDMRCWNSIIEEQKIQHFVSSFPKPKIEKIELPIIKTFSSVSIESNSSVKYGEFDAQSTRHENFPKFMKYRLFHEFLFYLIYNYPAEVEKIPVKKAIEIWQKENQRITDYDEIAERISTCYSTDISWKMFIPPLNQHLDYQDGWGLLRDIIHRIPLILFVKFTRYAKETTELDEYIMHPIKSNYLLHFLPQKLRSHLLQGRKFVASVSELCKRLCWMGLLQFGPSRTKEIDQTYVYLNRNAMLLDTRSSDIGYLEVSKQNYPKLKFYFDSFDSITSYWTSMFEICINTKINKKTTAIGRIIILEPLYTKQELVHAMKPQTAESAPLNDKGEVPGDRKGAGGLDKGFMSHLKQSWSRTIDKKRRLISALAVDRLPKRARKENVDAVKRRRKFKPPSTSTQSVPKAKAGATTKSKSVLPSRNPGGGVSSKSKIIRKIKARKRTIKELKKRCEMYDDVDKEALKLMKTLRVTWSEIEDKTLLLSKVAMKFAFPIEAQRSHYINCAVIRDILHWRTDRALNKTSKACQRRINYLMKHNKQFREQAFLSLEELRANREFVSKYNNFAERLKKLYNQEQIYVAVKIHLVEMVHRMHQIFLKEFLDNSYEKSTSEAPLKLLQNYDELVERFNVVNPNALIADYKYYEPKNSTEIEISMLSSLIHGAVCSANDKIKNPFFLLETYKKYSDDHLGAAVSQLRQLAVVSLNKNHRARDKVVMPYSISPFHLSNRYASQLISVHVPVELYDEYLVSLRTLSANTENLHRMKTVNCGWVFMLAEMLCSGKMAMVTDTLSNSEAALRKNTIFDRFSENYLIMKRNKEQQKNENKLTRMFRLPVDNNSDEKFIFNDDPLEIFFKLDSRYLHIFCILQSIEHHQRNDIEKWSIQEDDEECTFKHCIIRAGASFSIEIQKIACHCFKIIKSILNDEEPEPSKYDESSITKYNVVKFFDDFIEKYSEQKKAAMRKDIGKTNVTEFHRKVSTKFLLNAIQRLSMEIDIEDGAWLSEYKKISHKNDDEIFDDEDDIDTTKSLTHPQKDLNTGSKHPDTFVINLSSIVIEIKEDRNKEKCAIDGETFGKGLIPFSEQERSKILDEIKEKHVWMPDDLIKRSFEDAIAKIIISKKNTKLLRNIWEFIKAQCQMGATVDKILEQFGEKNRIQLHIIIDALIKNKLILRTGVNEVRFIHKEFAAFWLVDTFYLTPKDNDSEPIVKKAKGDDDKVVRVPTNNDVVAMDIETSTEAAPPAPQHQEEEDKKSLIRNPYYVLPSPWIRVGPLSRTLNRRCMDKWLGSILNHISINPSILLSDLCLKFNIITPVQVLNLCEILESIGCVRLMAYSPLEISIFSEYDQSDEVIEAVTHLDKFDQIFIEPKTDAFQRFTFFVGKKKYKLPFV